MKLRSAEYFNQPPPNYDPKSNFFTLTLHFGGKLHIGDQNAYIGGAIYKFDYFEFELLVLDYLEKVAKHEGVKKPMRVFTNVNSDGFTLIKDDTDLVRICEEKIKFAREINLYIEEVRNFCPYGLVDHIGEEDKYEAAIEVAVEYDSDGLGNKIRLEDFGDENDGVVNDVCIERAVDDESDDFSESYYSDENSEDDKLFDKNVDSESEWFRKDFESQKVPSEYREDVFGEKNLVDSGIPCKHALSAIHAQNLDYYNFIDNCYKLETYKLVYAPAIVPINGRNTWKPTNMIPLLPPNFGRPAGRPKKARRRERDEVEQKKKKKPGVKAKQTLNNNRMKRQQTTIKCSKCGEKGHNRKTCTSNIEPPNPNITQEMDASQEAMGHLTQEHSMSQMESQRPKKLQVRRKVTMEEVAGESSKKAMSKKKVPNKSIGGGNQLQDGPITSPPSMFEQFQRCQLPMVNIRVPTPFVGGSFITSAERCITGSCTNAKEIITQSGKKYVTLSGLNLTATEMKAKMKQKVKGKETEN